MYVLTHTYMYIQVHTHTHTHTRTHTCTNTHIPKTAGRFANVFTFIDGITTLSDGGEEVACLFVSVRGFCTAYARNWQN